MGREVHSFSFRESCDVQNHFSVAVIPVVTLYYQVLQYHAAGSRTELCKIRQK